MFRSGILITAIVALSCALPAQKPEPGDLALVLGEDEFEDYLDEWLATEEQTVANVSDTNSRTTGCTLRVNGDLGQPQPVYVHNNRLLQPTGNTGLIHLTTGDQVYIGCPGFTIQHPNIAASVATGWVTCIVDDFVLGTNWLTGFSQFGGLTCSANVRHSIETLSERCYDNNIVIRVGHEVDGIFYPLYFSCFDQNRLEVLYTWYEQNPRNAVHQTGVARPSWAAGTYFPGVSINTLYTQVAQKAKIASVVGEELADKYVTTTQFLARGHLSAKTDFIFATGQRASFFFINAAPQWQPFNAGNWNWVEQNLRARIGEAGYHTTVFTGTFGISQLRNATGHLVDIYLHHDENNNPQLPVPLYYYKVVYDADLQLGTAFVSINNPYYTEEEVKALTFCTDRCRNNSAFSWLRWQPDRIDIGYSFCCEVDDFRRTVPHLPNFTVVGLLA